MSTARFALATTALLALCQCESPIGNVDSRSPTVEQQDKLDVQWGLQPRKTKGSPRRFVPTGMDLGSSPVPTTTVPRIADQPSTAPAAAAPASAPAAAEPAPVKVDESVLQKLR
jgi:hypothetical protein